jgi:serine/threonine protein kinase/cytochrome c-type biogenesis protein CcmH/NrfG
MASEMLDEKAIFNVARQIGLPDARAEYLRQACGADSALRERVQVLLNAYEEQASFLESPPPVGGAATTDQPASEPPGTVIGPYKLIEEIGEGGMGTVWMAQQTEPVKRLVALKLIKPGMDSKQVIARFEAERQALALMDHPNIAKVLDGGTTPSGRPYFVMDLVKGVPITRYCDEHRLTPRQRLELFLPVCQAVQHAHQKGIIHRDLKPSNVLVALYDGKPVPKVIDFGVAKAAGQSLTDKTLVTGFGNIVGTLEYMSPEQAEVNQLDIDTRSDVYSLGVLLYELLAGSPPFTRKELEKGGLLEMLRVIREQEPSKPSTKLSRAEGLPTLATNRGTEPAKLTRLVRGELDWVVMRALEKDRNRRYETANAFALDVQRYLADEAVQACPPSLGYRFKKFARRNKRALGGAGVLAVALLVAVGAIAGSVGWTLRDQEARRAKLAGQLDLILDEVEQYQAEQKWPEALAAARKAEALLAGGGGGATLEGKVNEALADLNLVRRLEGIRMAHAGQGGRRFEWAAHAYAAAFRDAGVDLDRMSTDEVVRRLRARKQVAPALAVILDEWSLCRTLSRDAQGARSVAAVARGLDPDPLRRQVREALAQIDVKTYRIADAKAIETLERLAASPDLVRQPPPTLCLLGVALSYGTGKPKQGIAVLREAHAQHPGDFWVNAMLAWNLRFQGPDHQDEALGFYRAALALRPDSGWIWLCIGLIHDQHRRKPDEAIACYKKGVALDPRNPWIHNALAGVHKAQNRLDESTACSQKAVACFRESIKHDAKYDPFAHFTLANILRDQGKLDEAVACYKNAIAINATMAEPHSNLGGVLRRQKKFDEAVTSYRRAIEINPKNASGYSGLGVALLERHLAARDPKSGEKTVAAFRQAVALDPNHAYSQYVFGVALMESKKVDEALAAFRKAVELDPKRVDAHTNLAWVLATASDPRLLDPQAALAHARKAVELQPQTPNHWSNLGVALLRTGDAKGAVEALEKADQMWKGGDHQHRFFLAMAYGHVGEKDKARQAHEQGVRWMDKHHPNNEDLRRIRAEAARLLGIEKKKDSGVKDRESEKKSN